MKKHLLASFIAVFIMALGVSFAQNQVNQQPEAEGQEKDKEKTAAPTQAEGPSKPLPPDIPLIQNSEGYQYDPTGRRDPFKPYGQSQAASAPGSEPALPPEPLQQFEVGQLKLVGIIWEVKNPKAMIKDPLGKLHLIRKQTKIGRNNGFVAAIREGEVIVVEPTVGENGAPTAITRVLNLTR